MRPKHYVGLFLFAVVGLSATGMLSNLFGGASSAQDAPQQKEPNPFALPPLSPPVMETPSKKAELPPAVQPESPLPPPILPVGAKVEAPKKPAPQPQADELPPLVPPPPPIPGLESKKEPQAKPEPQPEEKPAPPAPLSPIPGLELKKEPQAKPEPQPEEKPAPLSPIPLNEKPVANPPVANPPVANPPVANPQEPKKDSLPPLPGLEPKGPSSIDPLPPPAPPAPPVKSSQPEPKKELTPPLPPSVPQPTPPLPPSVPQPTPKIEEPSVPAPMPSLTPAPQPMSTPPSPPLPAPPSNPLPQANEPKVAPGNLQDFKTPSQPPALNQVLKTKGSPWTLLVAMTDDHTTVTATINNKHAFQIKCQNAELMSAKGTFEATGKVTFQSEGFEGQCDRFSISLGDDRVVLEGGAEVRVQSKATRRFNSGGSEEAAPQVELKGQRLDLRVGDLMPRTTQSGGGVGSTQFPNEIQLVSASRVRMAAAIFPDRQWSDVGTLRATDLQHEGQPVWSLVNDQGRTLLHLTTRAGRSLRSFEGRVIALGGSYVENAPMGTLMIATEIMIP